MRALWLFGAACLAAPLLFGPAMAQAAEEIQGAIPRPLPGHPGNIFLAGEEVVPAASGEAAGAWRAVDYDGKLVAEGDGSGPIRLGRLPVGYYEIHRGASERPIVVGVLAPLAAPTPKSSPIGVDAAIAWFYRDARIPAAANLCALAGMNWVRDRLTWGQIEPRQGEFAAATPYDVTAREQLAAGLRVLQVNHLTPAWAGREDSRFPPDLRDAYRFYREAARRWKGLVEAFEPWNEPDIPRFGGHTGSEIASMQKACYWGLKAGNPDAIVCQNVFALYLPEVMADFQANEVWPYFDTLNFHHYRPLEVLPRIYEQFRAISGGRPMWVTECNLPSRWAGEAAAGELTPEEERRSAERVAKIFALSLHGGSSATFWFVFPHFVEGVHQFGVVRADLTPRPAYLALAAVGRLLADARPVGRLKTAGPESAGYLFRARPDGKQCVVLVAWRQAATATLELAAPPVAVFDAIGREKDAAGAALAVGPAPVFALFAAEARERFEFVPAPTLPPRAEGDPSPIVLQAVWPAAKSTAPFVKGSPSHYLIARDGPESMPIFVYNFGAAEAKGRLRVHGPEDWQLHLPEEVSIQPLERVGLALTYDLREAKQRARATVRIDGDFGPAGKPLLSIRLFPSSTQEDAR